MYLVESEVEQVAQYLRELGRLGREQREEILDHLCCDIEKTMEQGVGFLEAFNHCRERWNENEVKKIHSSTQNTSIMVKLLTVVLLACSTFSFLSRPLELGTDLSNSSVEQEQFLDEIEPPAYCPLSTDYRLTAAYGEMRHPITKRKQLHRGIDWGAPSGTPVKAAGAGTVLEAANKGNYGNCIIIVHDEIYQSLYAHLQSLDVKPGDIVTAGQLIGKVGSTGLSTGSHLHYEVLRNGEPVNPADYLP